MFKEPNEKAILEYIIDMLQQLAKMARRVGQVKLADRLDTVILAEQAVPVDAKYVCLRSDMP